MSEREISADQVKREHLAEVDVRAHWLYLVSAIVGGTVAMILLIALLDALG